MGLLIGPRGSNQKRMEDESGARILIRGKGSSKDPSGEPDGEEELHVLITAESDEAIAKAQSAVENILFNPQQAMRLKQEQLRKVAELNNTLNDNYGGGGGHYGPGQGGSSSHAQDSKSSEMQVPRDLVGYIIGRGGETIRELQMKSGAQIQIVREDFGGPPQPHRLVGISGDDEAIERARHLIQKLIDERVNGGRDSRDDRGGRFGGSNPDGSETLEILVPNDRVGLIIGRAGATIKAIQFRTGTSINIPQTADSNNPNMRLVTVNGTREAKELARTEIMSIINEDPNNRHGPVGNTIYMQVPNDRVGVVIGKRGETVKGMQDRYGVRIQIPTVPDAGSNPSVRTISISGPQDACFRAKEEIDMVILNGAGTQGAGSGASQQYGSYYGYGSGYDQYSQQQQQYGYDQSQYDAYYQQYYQQAQTTADGTAAAAPGAEAAATEDATTAAGAAASTGDAAATTAAADPNDPNAYWNGFYEYAAYYGIDAANEAWGVTGEAAKQSAESYRQYQEQAAAAAAAGGATDGAAATTADTSSSTTGDSKAESGPPGV
ncbi:hypothetical protein PINS_up007525 [Pythium insidiosum]|nr:hypothetical protein PINS_up007525 [Pythium insidiosum]